MTATLETPKARILTVDDDRTTLAILAITIRRAGYEIVQASSAEEALDMIAETQPDLAVLDISMPGMSGIELAQRLRDESTIPFMFLSTHAEPDIVREARCQGAVGYLVKPLDFNRVVSVIEAGLARALTERRSPVDERASREQMQSDLMGRYAELTELEIRLQQVQAGHEKQPTTHAGIRMLEGTIRQLNRILDAYRGTSAASMRDAQACADLSAIRSRLLLNRLRPDTPVLHNEYRTANRRIHSIVQHLKDVSLAGPAARWEYSDLHTILDRALDNANRGNTPASVRKDYREYGKPILIECLPAPIEQVFQHLFLNAMQSIPGSMQGRIGVRTGMAGAHAWAEISDNGCGIGPAERELIFQPFFSTRPAGAGLGLGLTISRDIVRMHRGDMSVNSTIGEGSVFRVSLPVRQATGVNATITAFR